MLSARMLDWEKDLLSSFSETKPNIRCYQTVSSTMDVARDLMEKESLAPLIVIAKTQSLGKGRMGAPWHTQEGSFAATFVFTSQDFNHALSSFSLVIALKLIQHLDPDLRKLLLKWPNDLLAKDFKKVAGILIERYKFRGRAFCSVGVGVNIQSAPEVLNAIDLKTIGIDFDLNKFLPKFYSDLTDSFKIFAERGFDPFCKSWEGASVKRGTRIEFDLNHQNTEGFYQGIDEQGRIKIEVEGVQRLFSSLEISKIDVGN